MKNYFCVIGIIASIIIFNQCNNQKFDYTQNNISESRDSILNELNNIFVGDSGYILKNNGLEILKHLASKDITFNIEPQYKEYMTWDSIPSTDTLGIYYKDEGKNSYHAFIENIAYIFDTSLIIEVDIEKQSIKPEEFHGAMYKCCWNGRFDGFRKIGKYYYIKVCGTGSGYCAGDFYLFQDFSDIGNTICESAFSSMMYVEGQENFGYGHLDSDLTLTEKGIQMDYTFEEGMYIEVNDSTIFPHKLKTRKFKVDYTFQDGEWRATDSTMFKTISLPL